MTCPDIKSTPDVDCFHLRIRPQNFSHKLFPATLENDEQARRRA
jgi:hypothetical protein